jgi:hypothetical protein
MSQKSQNAETIRKTARAIEETFGTFIIEGTRRRENVITRVAFTNAIIENKPFPMSISLLAELINKNHATLLHYRKSKYMYESESLYVDVYNKTRTIIVRQGDLDNNREESILEIIENIKDLADLLKMNL